MFDSPRVKRCITLVLESYKIRKYWGNVKNKWLHSPGLVLPSRKQLLGPVFKNHVKTDIRVLSPLLADRYYWFLNTVS